MRISTTTLESFRLFLDPEQDWMTEEALVATIRGEFTPTPQILLGRAFDAVLNTPDRYRVEGGFRAEGYFFSDLAMTPALAIFDRRGVFQVKAERAYGEATVVCVADQLVGASAVENKTTTSAFDFDKYAASCQWRFLVDIFAAARVTYNVFLLSAHDGFTEIGLRGIESFSVYPYAALHQDCAALVGRFVDYVRSRGLDGLLVARQARAEALAAF